MSTEDESVAEDNKCLLCRGDAERSGGDPRTFKCDRCGNYQVEKFVDLAYRDALAEELFPLSPIARDHWECLGTPLLITKHNVDDLKSRLPREHDVTDKAQRLLRALARRTEHPGYRVKIDPGKDYPLAYAATNGEFRYYWQHLVSLGWIDCNLNSHFLLIRLTPEGWAEIERLRHTNVESEKVFVAMRFGDEELDSAYDDGMQPAIEQDCGYRPIRVDREEYLGCIDDRMIAEIRESRFVVADVTEQRQGVYFEAGFALGFGLPVIWACRDDDIEKVHFDTRQQNHIVWADPGDLREKLTNRIRAVIGLGPNKTEA